MSSFWTPEKCPTITHTHTHIISLSHSHTHTHIHIHKHTHSQNLTRTMHESRPNNCVHFALDWKIEKQIKIDIVQWWLHNRTGKKRKNQAKKSPPKKSLTKWNILSLGFQAFLSECTSSVLLCIAKDHFLLIIEEPDLSDCLPKISFKLFTIENNRFS